MLFGVSLDRLECVLGRLGWELDRTSGRPSHGTVCVFKCVFGCVFSVCFQYFSALFLHGGVGAFRCVSGPFGVGFRSFGLGVGQDFTHTHTHTHTHVHLYHHARHPHDH